MEENGRNTYPMKRVCLSSIETDSLVAPNWIQVVAEEMKRFDQINQGAKKEEIPNASAEKKPGSDDKKTLDETKKHLGFQWDQSPK